MSGFTPMISKNQWCRLQLFQDFRLTFLIINTLIISTVDAVNLMVENHIHIVTTSQMLNEIKF